MPEANIENKSLLTDKARQLLDPNFVFSAVENLLTNSQKSEVSCDFSDEVGVTNSFCLFDLQVSSDYHTPHSLKQRMFLSEINIVGNLTDISNYLLYDIGQPTHFFSHETVTKNSNTLQWSVTQTTEETPFEGLGQLKKTTLPKATTVIENDSGEILALPGISGANNSKVEQDTRVVVEIANFFDEDVARQSFALKYRSQASKTWAGSVNQALSLVALLKLVMLLPEADFKPIILWRKNLGSVNILHFIHALQLKTIEVRLDKLASKLDSKKLSEWNDLLINKLCLIGKYDVKTGFFERELFYSNLKNFDDVFEDVSRLVGYDALAQDYLKTEMKLPETNYFDGIAKLKKMMSKFGFDEVITRPFVANQWLANPDNSLELMKAQNSTAPFVRDTLFSSLMDTVSKNMLRGVKDPSVFELNQIYSYPNKQLTEQTSLEAISVTDQVYELTACAYGLLNTVSTETPMVEAKNTSLGQGYSYSVSGFSVDLLEVANKYKKQFGIPLSKHLYYLQVNLTGWEGKTLPAIKYYDESEYSIITRSYSLAIQDSKTRWMDIKQELVLNNNFSNKNVRLDIQPIERRVIEGAESLTFTIDFVSYSSTLTNEEIAEWETGVFEKLHNSNGVTVR